MRNISGKEKVFKMDFLPCEVISQVFSNIHPIYSDLVTLRQVCWKWKRIIDSTCRLWKHIHLDDHQDCIMEEDEKYTAVLIFCLRTYGQFIQCIRAGEQPCLNNPDLSKHIPQLKNLRKLDVPWLTWSKEMAESFQSKSLRYVTIGHSMYQEHQSASYLEELKALPDEGLFGCDLKYLHTWFPNLEYLGLHTDIYKIRPNGVVVSMLDPMVKLKELSLELGPHLLAPNGDIVIGNGSPPVREIMNSRHCSILKSLELRCVAVSSKELMEFTRGLTGLRHLAVGSLATRNNEVFNTRLVLESSSIEVLFLSSLPSSWTQTIKIIMPELEALVISECIDLISLELLANHLMTLILRNDVSLGHIYAKCECLTNLELVECFEFSFESFRKFAKGCQNLMRIELTSRWQSIELTSQDCPNLRELTIKDAELSLMQVKIDCPTLEIFKCASSNTPRKDARQYTYDKYQFEIICEDLEKFHICEAYYATHVRVKCQTIGVFDMNGQLMDPKPMDLYIKATGGIDIILLKELSFKSIRIYSPSISDIILDTCCLPLRKKNKRKSKMIIKCAHFKALRLIKCDRIKRLVWKVPQIQQLSLDSCSNLYHLDIAKTSKVNRVRIVNCPLLNSNRTNKKVTEC